MKIVQAVAVGMLAVFAVGSPLARAYGPVTECSEQGLLDALIDGGEVTFDLDADCEITLTSPITIDIDTSLVNESTHKVTIKGDGTLLLFNVEALSRLELFNITIANGRNTNGGAVYVNEEAALFASNCVFSGNSAVGSNGVAGANGRDDPSIGRNGSNGRSGTNAMGGAIYNLGELTLCRCQFLTNSAVGGDGGNGGNGGNGGFNGGNGGAGGSGGLGYGGAVYNAGAPDLVSLTDCTFANNIATGGNGGNGGTNGTGGASSGLPGNGGTGGAAFGAGFYSLNNAIVLNCTFSDNTAHGGNSMTGGTLANGNGTAGSRGADGSGGGICNVAAGTAVTNCTFSANKVIGGNGADGGNGSFNGGKGGDGGNGSGGALYNSGTIDVVNCTFANGSAAGGTNGLGGAGGVASGQNGNKGLARGGNLANVGTLTLKNSIIATNLSGGNGYGMIIDAGNNFSSDNTLHLSADGSTNNINPKIGSLADNGGPTKTIAVLAGSPAIDVGDNDWAPDFDQRGVPRKIDDEPVDLGAYERALLLITQQPADQTVHIGADASFAVEAVGEPTITYRWRFFGTNLPSGATSNTFTVRNVQSSNAGPYQVVVANSSGSVTSAVATLNVVTPPSITMQPTNLSATVGGSATFSVAATGTQPLAYQWRFNGTNISGATGTSYTVSNVQPADAGAYSVAVTNEVGSVTSTNAILTVNTAPTIVSQPASQSILVGDPVSFNVTATGTGTLTYQWRFFGTNLSGATAATFSRSSVQTNHAGPYDVVVGNNFGTTESASAILTVRVPTLSGRVTEGENGLAGVTLAASNNAITNSTATDMNGNYSLSGIPAGTYDLTPSRAGYEFDPATISVTVTGDVSGLNFAALALFTVSGRVTEGTNGLSGVKIAADETHTALTDINGDYTLGGLRAGSFVSAELAGYVFSPPSQEVTNNMIIDFVVTNRVYDVGGRITEEIAGLSGIRVDFRLNTGEFAGSATTDSNGNYIRSLFPGTYTLTPRPGEVGFNPASRTVTVPPAATNLDFAAGVVFTSIVLSDQGAALSAIARRSKTYSVEASTDLISWESISTSTPSLNRLDFLDTSASNFPLRFYRILVQ